MFWFIVASIDKAGFEGIVDKTFKSQVVEVIEIALC